MSPSRFFFPVVVLLLSTSFLGCGSNPPALVPVQGKVSYRGIPLSTGTVVFIPDSSRGNTGPLAKADVGPDGRYTLRTDDKLGVLPGWYRVTVAAFIMPSAGDSFRMPESLLPDHYRDPDMSGITCEVRAGQENTLDFNLE